jgi:hypothetical protein
VTPRPVAVALLPNGVPLKNSPKKSDGFVLALDDENVNPPRSYAARLRLSFKISYASLTSRNFSAADVLLGFYVVQCSIM